MRRALVKIIPLAILSLALSAFSQTRQSCSILRAVEGCRVELVSGEIIRLIGVQLFPNFPQNISFLDSLIVAQSAELEFDDNLSETLGYLWCDSLLINIELLRRGWARIWEDTAKYQYQEIFLMAEGEARANRRGNWKNVVIDSARSTAGDTVYVTKSGKKYHSRHCRLLSQNKTSLPLSQARYAYSPCRLCAASTGLPKEALLLQENGKAAGAPCLATTKSGDRCKRQAQAGSKYCWQHHRK